jgi:hypothetical protein
MLNSGNEEKGGRGNVSSSVALRRDMKPRELEERTAFIKFKPFEIENPDPDNWKFNF